jgi:hypothetical protein
MRSNETNKNPLIFTAKSHKTLPDTMSLEFASSGGYIPGEEREFIRDLIAHGKPIDGWSLWVDIDGHKRPAVYTMAAFKKLCENNDVALLRCMARKRDGSKFPVPRLKITPKDKPSKTTKSDRFTLR